MSRGKEYTAEYKAKVVIEILRETNTVSEIGARENVSPKVLYNWKKEFLENAYQAFSVNKDEKIAKDAMKAAANLEHELMAKIGQLTYECDWLKKNMQETQQVRKTEMLDEDEPRLSIRRQCELLGCNRSSHYYEPRLRLRGSHENREMLMNRLDYWNTIEPAWGVKTLVLLLKNEGSKVGPELVRELRAEMGLETVYPKENMSKNTKNA